MGLLEGVLIFALSASGQTFAQHVQKIAQRPARRRPLLNLLGVLVQVLCGPLDLAAYSFAPQSLLAPFGVFGLLVNLVISPRLHGEKLGWNDLVATALIAAGTVGCLVSGPDGDVAKLAVPDGAARVYVAVIVSVCAGLAGLVLSLERRGGGGLAASAHASLAGVLGSSTVVAGKVLLGATEASPMSVLPRLPVLLAVVVLHLLVMNRGVGRHSMVVMAPVNAAAGLLATVATGFGLYGEVPSSPHGFCAAMALICGGTLCLAAGG